ncbi:hypothetical protein [Pseudomonas fluorescens]|uniref:hypothetical protein n=1 Tax=Pseudomonas fluorescens TaxID=294 RepID=UPI000B12D9C1
MEIAPHFIIHETEHWIINHHLANTLPGYLILGTKVEAASLTEGYPSRPFGLQMSISDTTMAQSGYLAIRQAR